MKRGGGLLVVTALVFVVVEGSASTAIAVYEAVRGPQEGMYSQYDSLLGWVNVPGLAYPDRWGPGRGVHIDVNGFRSRYDVTTEVPTGRVRLLCSGDSFAFGEGVGDEETWCHLLTRRDETLETVNLGQPGYGIDQAYLRYARDGVRIDHKIHLFTFIGADISRIGQATYYGYGKPTFRAAADSLVLANVPVPRSLPAAARFVQRLAERLRSVEFAGRLARRLGLSPLSSPPVPEEDRDRMTAVAAMIFRNLQRLAEETGTLVVFVYLPVDSEIDRDGEWRAWTHEVMDRLGLLFIDLTPKLREVDRAEAAGFFIRPGDPGSGHYSAEGNEWVATTLYDGMRSLSAVERRLATRRDQPEGWQVSRRGLDPRAAAGSGGA